MSQQQQMLYSTGMIAKRAGAAIHQVKYVIESRRIEPLGKVAGANAYDEAAVRRIEAALTDIAQARKTAWA